MVPESEWVNASGYISDESSFYGDSATKSRLETMASSFDPSTYWETHPQMLSTIAALERQRNIFLTTRSIKCESANEMDIDLPTPPPEKGKSKGRAVKSEPQETALSLIYDADNESPQSAWHQPYETVDEFLKRLPPINPPTAGPWLWVENPQAKRQRTKFDLKDFLDEGSKLLEAFMTVKERIALDNPGKPQAAVTRKVTPFKNKLKEDILQLAVEKGVSAGKWMLFPSQENATRMWRSVAAAILSGRLGSVAKIASSGDSRLMCIYTDDFTDMVDVTRVLEEIADIGYVKRDAVRGIYYKCDAFTYLGINSGNEFGLPASLYGSWDIFKEANAARGLVKRKVGVSENRESGMGKRQKKMKNDPKEEWAPTRRKMEIVNGVLAPVRQKQEPEEDDWEF